MRWPKGPPHLALNPPFFAFCFSYKNRKKLFFPLKKGDFCCSFFCVSLCFFAFWGFLLFHFLFFCLSFSLSLSLSLSLSFSLSLSLSLSLCFFSLSLSLFFFLFSFPFCFSFLHLFLVFYIFVLFVFLSCFSVLVFWLLSCFVLNHNLRFGFVLHFVFSLLLLLLLLLFFVFVAFMFFFLIFFDFWKPIKNISEKKMEIPKTTKMKNAGKTDILTRTVSTGVFTNSVCVCAFLCFFQFCIFAENTTKIRVSAKKQKIQS